VGSFCFPSAIEAAKHKSLLVDRTGIDTLICLIAISI
jgi:hypothetical protein